MRFVGTEGEYGENLALTKDWAVRIIKNVGNYGEMKSTPPTFATVSNRYNFDTI